jgi:uncharacterized protein (TIGR03067 family)
MRLPLLLILSVGFLVGAEKPLGHAVKKDLEKLQGKWDLVSAEMNGKDVTNFGKNSFSMMIKDRKLLLEFGGNKLDLEFQLDPTKVPKEITFTTSGSGKSFYGIYAIDGGKLKLSWLQVGKGKPKSFTTQAKTPQVTFVVRRIKS